MPIWVAALLGAAVLVCAGLVPAAIGAPAWVVVPVWVVLLGVGVWWLGWRATAGAGATAAVVLPIVLDLIDPGPAGADESDGD